MKYYVLIYLGHESVHRAVQFQFTRNKLYTENYRAPQVNSLRKLLENYWCTSAVAYVCLNAGTTPESCLLPYTTKESTPPEAKFRVYSVETQGGGGTAFVLLIHDRYSSVRHFSLKFWTSALANPISLGKFHFRFEITSYFFSVLCTESVVGHKIIHRVASKHLYFFEKKRNLF